MVNCIFPDPSKLFIKYDVTPNILINKYLKYFEGVADVKIKHKDSFFGFLPLKKDGKLLFPVGNFRGVYNFNELRFALEYGVIEITKVYYVIFAPPIDSPFDEFVNTLYNERKKTNSELDKLVLKLLLNSLYGKFAQRIKSEMIYIDNMYSNFDLIAEYKEKKTLIRIMPFSKNRNDCFIEVKSKKGYLYNTIPVFSSYITSFARIMLLKFMLENAPNDVLYCDTDSIFLNKLPKLPVSAELGAWKKEKKVVTDIRGLKNYSYLYNNQSFDKIKGIPKNATKDGNIYTYETLVKTREGLRRNIETGVLEKRSKKLSGVYDKRIILKNGYSIPIKL